MQEYAKYQEMTKEFRNKERLYDKEEDELRGKYPNGRYSDESSPLFRTKVPHLFRSKVRQLDRPLSPLSKGYIFQT